MSIFLDIAILLIVALFTFIGIKRGILKTATDLAGFVVILVLAVIISDTFTVPIYNTVFKSSVESKIESAIEDGKSFTEIYDSLPSIVKKSSKNTGITAETLEKKQKETAEKTAHAIADYVAKPAITALISVVLYIIVFILGSILLRVAVKWVTKLIDKTFVGTINTTLGGVFGAFTGIVAVFALVWLLDKATSSYGSVFGITKDALDKSTICSIINSISPLA